MVPQYIFQFLSKIYHPFRPVPTVPKKIVYFSDPYLNHSTVLMTSKLSKSISHHFPHLDLRFSYRSTLKISSFFRYKSTLPFPLKASSVYKFTCPSCQKGYIGSTARLLRTRIFEHQGLSHRTSLPLSILLPFPTFVPTQNLRVIFSSSSTFFYFGL